MSSLQPLRVLRVARTRQAPDQLPGDRPGVPPSGEFMRQPSKIRTLQIGVLRRTGLCPQPLSKSFPAGYRSGAMETRRSELVAAMLEFRTLVASEPVDAVQCPIDCFEPARPGNAPIVGGYGLGPHCPEALQRVWRTWRNGRQFSDAIGAVGIPHCPIDFMKGGKRSRRQRRNPPLEHPSRYVP